MKGKNWTVGIHPIRKGKIWFTRLNCCCWPDEICIYAINVMTNLTNMFAVVVWVSLIKFWFFYDSDISGIWCAFINFKDNSSNFVQLCYFSFFLIQWSVYSTLLRKYGNADFASVRVHSCFIKFHLQPQLHIDAVNAACHRFPGHLKYIKRSTWPSATSDNIDRLDTQWTFLGNAGSIFIFNRLSYYKVVT